MPDRRIIVEYVGDRGEPPEDHAREAERRQDARTRSIFEQRRRWPNVCVQCGGDGGKAEDDENNDEDEIDIELCPGCLGQGKCPKCKHDLPENWKTVLEALNRAVLDRTAPPPPVRCGECNWKDGDDPVIEV